MDIKIAHKAFKPYQGCVLLSEPFLADPNFKRTAVLLAAHNDTGSFGFVINRLLNLRTSELIPNLLNVNFPVFYGGPVENNTIHFIHKNHQYITGAQQITNNIYWGGNLDEVNDITSNNAQAVNDFKFFLGYSGWAENQLSDEMMMKSWWITKAYTEFIFSDDLDEMWKNFVKKLGPDFSYLANAPDDFTLN